MYFTRNVKDDLVWVGADDRRLACFEGVYGVPDGVSYNSYLLLDEKTVLFDTVDKAVYQVFFENVKHALGGRKLDYLVISHMEPDHAYTVEALLIRYPETRIICNEKIRTMLGQFFDMDLEGRLHIVKEGDVFSTGRHNLTFVMAPMVHWPEVMMTYDLTDGILFSADAFGTFGALNGRLFSDEWDFFAESMDEARRYYTNIVGKYGAQVQNVLKKASGLALNYVCPLHGPVWRSHFGDFLEKYLRWSSYTPEEESVCLAYASVYGHTENAANILAGKLAERGVRVRMFDTSVTPASYIISAAFRCSHLVLASATYNAGIFVTMDNLVNDLVNHNLCNRRVAVIENGSWAPTSGGLIREKLRKLKGTEFIADTVSIRSSLKNDQLSDLDALSYLIAQEIRPAAAAASSENASGGDRFSVDDGVFRHFTYGVEILTTRVDGKDYGCVINTAGQVASTDPRQITISVIKKNNTCDMVARAGIFNLSILTEDAPFSLFERFGFQSGRDVDKFAGLEDTGRMQNGVCCLNRYANAVLSCKITDVKDLGTQVLYIADVLEAKVLSDAPSCTYAYYHAHIKPKKNPAKEEKEGYVCRVCGYFHEGSELPEDFVCPLCKHGAEEFEHVVPAVVNKQKGWLCTVCGHFEPCEGELPADYSCPLCHHGREDFERAEQ